jgi:hypothetical protein
MDQKLFMNGYWLCGEAAPTEYQVKYWPKQFIRGRKSTEDDPCHGKASGSEYSSNVPEN